MFRVFFFVPFGFSFRSSNLRPHTGTAQSVDEVCSLDEEITVDVSIEGYLVEQCTRFEKE